MNSTVCPMSFLLSLLLHIFCLLSFSFFLLILLYISVDFFFALYWPLLITLFAFAFALAVGHIKQAERKIWQKFPARPPKKVRGI